MDSLMNTVKQRATEQLDTQKSRATDGLSVIAGAVRHTTQQLRNDQHDDLAQYVDRVAEQLERFSSAIREKPVDELLRDARQFARRQPALFIGGSFAAGLLAARFLKSSRRDNDDVHDERTYGSSEPGVRGTASSRRAEASSSVAARDRLTDQGRERSRNATR